MCREVITVDMEALSKAAPPEERESARNFELDENLLMLQKKMAALFKHQQSRGGIIDLEAEESKLLLVTGAVSFLKKIEFECFILKNFNYIFCLDR